MTRHFAPLPSPVPFAPFRPKMAPLAATTAPKLLRNSLRPRTASLASRVASSHVVSTPLPLRGSATTRTPTQIAHSPSSLASASSNSFSINGRRGFASAPPSPQLVSEYSQHAELLSSLGLGETNAGVFDGEWKGSGPKIYSLNPSTGRVIAEVTTGSADELETAIARSRAAWQSWKTVRFGRLFGARWLSWGTI